jgi:hypothetical protein
MDTKKTTSSKKRFKATLTLSTPYISHYNMVAAFFKGDEEVVVGYTKIKQHKGYEFFIKSDNKDKIAALNKILVKDEIMENLIQVRPRRIKLSDSKITLKDFEVALSGNKYYKNIHTVVKGSSPEISYIMMSAEPVQFYNDQLDDYYGNKTMVVRDIMDIICVKLENVYFSTELIEK